MSVLRFVVSVSFRMFVLISRDVQSGVLDLGGVPEGQGVWHDAQGFSEQERLVGSRLDDVHFHVFRRYCVDNYCDAKLLPLFLYECCYLLKRWLGNSSKRDAERVAFGLREADLVE